MDFSSEPIVHIKNASILQEGNTILKNVNFSIEKGEFVYLVGKTGAGKSSLMKTIYADLDLKIGQANVAGFELLKINSSKIPYLRRKIGIIFQDFQLLSDRTAVENLLFVMKATGWSGKEKIANKISQVLMQVGLDAKKNSYPHQLSGGEQQRLVIARALINDPLILIADEPTGNLDPEVADDIINLFRKINNGGTAILMATHNHNFLHKYPARVLKCTDGEVIDSKEQEVSYSDI